MSYFARTGKCLLAALLVSSAASFAQQTPPPSANAILTIQAEKPVAKVSPTLYGLMTEEINYSYDGGIYAELVRNRTFHDDADTPVHWSLVKAAAASVNMEIDKTTGPSKALPISLKVTVTAATAKDPAGVANEGFWGIPVRPATTYKGSFYAKADSSFSGPISIGIVNNKTGVVAAQATVPALTSDWKQYTFELKTTGTAQTSADNHLQLLVTHPGTVWFDLVSLFPPTYDNQPNGNRIDLMDKLAAMKPAFLRLPGGNYLEGNYIPERFQWKKTIGPLVDRPTHPSPWGYQSSDGMGLLEFLQWCEDLHMQPVLAVYAGYSLKHDYIKPGADLEPYVQDALDEIQYVTGGTDTKWGAVRAKDGHPKPFPLTYVEIGNEDWFDKSGSYEGRFAQFYDAIKAKYPHLQLIATTHVKSRKPDVIDDHFYRKAEQFYNDVHHYDKTDRNGPKIFVGEWATREGSPTPNFGAALGDAAWMTGMERNSDIVIMASYAPLFVNVNPGGMQWKTDLIGYNTLTSYGSPSYYAQVMFSNHHGDEVLASDLQNAGPRLFYSITKNARNGMLYLKVVNAAATLQTLTVKLDGVKKADRSGTLIRMDAKSTTDTNTITDPTAIVPSDHHVKDLGTSFTQTFPAYSISILEWKTK
ncbi:MAG: alpha-L-arabinofuranosidase C-terminal domain-containing protein [Acidobacteriaceae bacterium]